MIKMIFNKIVSKLLHDSFIRVIAYIVILFTCFLIFIISYNALRAIDDATNDSKTFVIESKSKYDKIKEEYNKMRADIVIANSIDVSDITTTAKTEALITSIDEEIFTFKSDTANTLEFLDTRDPFESTFKDELVNYLTSIYNTPLITKENYQIYIYYIRYNQLNAELIKDLNKNTKTLSSVEELAKAQQILSEYIDKLQQIQIKLENIKVTLDYTDYKNKVALTLTELINYNVQVKSYYSQLSIALSKDLPDEVTKFIQAIKNINSGYLVSTNESKNKINQMWTQIKDDDYQFNLKSLEERNKIDSTYEELLTKYKIT